MKKVFRYGAGLRDLPVLSALGAADFKTNDALGPEHSAGYLGGGNKLLGCQPHVIQSRNLTLDATTGLDDQTAAQFAQATRHGLPTHGALRHPMPKYSVMSDEEVNAIRAYLQTVLKIRSATPEDGPAVAGQ